MLLTKRIPSVPPSKSTVVMTYNHWDRVLYNLDPWLHHFHTANVEIKCSLVALCVYGTMCTSIFCCCCIGCNSKSDMSCFITASMCISLHIFFPPCFTLSDKYLNIWKQEAQVKERCYKKTCIDSSLHSLWSVTDRSCCCEMLSSTPTTSAQAWTWRPHLTSVI